MALESRRDLNVQVSADSSKFEKGMKSAAASAKVFEKELQRQDAEIERFRESAGRAMLGVGVGVAAAAGLAVKAAMDWETAWTGVAKTVDGNAEQMAVLEGQLRSMARTLPASHKEIAAVAEAAGQLGIKREAVAEFTRTMIDLGNTTNLTAEEAATSIAQIANIMGTSQKDVDRFGAALVELGNNGASTEAEILEMTKRLAGAGKLIGASETDILAMANAMASIGINAEAGGGSMSRVMQKIYEAVSEGGDAVAGFAKVAGMSAQDFAEAFRNDPVRAINSFIDGLNDVESSGGNVVGVLKDLGIKGSEEMRTLLGLKGASDLLSESLDMGSQAWEENTALVEEAAKKYQTTGARLEIAKNNINDLGITIGQAVLPVLGEFADGVAGLIGVVQKMPGPLKTALGIFGGLVGVVGLVGGAALLAVPKIVEFRGALDTMGKSASRVNRGLGIAGGLLTGKFGLGLGLAVTALGFFVAQQAKAAAHVDDLTTSLDEQTGALTLESGALIFNKLQSEGAADAAERLGISQKDLLGAAMGLPGPLQRVNARLDEARVTTENWESTLSGGVASTTGQLTKDVNKLTGVIGGQNEAIDEATTKWKQEAEAGLHGAEAQKVVAEALDGTAASAGGLENSLAALAEAYGITGDEAEKAAQEMLDAWSEAFASFVGLGAAYNDALKGKEDKARELAEATAKSTKDASDSWADYIGDVKVTAQDFIAELQKQVDAQREWSDNLILLAARVPPAMLNELAKMGPEGAAQVALMATMTDAELKKVVTLWSQRSKEATDGAAQRLAEAGPILAAIANQIGQGAANKIAQGMAERGSTVFEEARRQGLNIDEGVDINRPRIVDIRANDKPAMDRLKFFKNNANRLLNSIDNEDVVVNAKLRFGGAGTGGTATNRLLSSTGRAQGGKLPGPPSNTDNMLVPMASGEYVVRASQVGKNLPLLEAINNGRLPEGYARGGMVNLKATGSMGNTKADLLRGIQQHAERNILDLLSSVGGAGGGAGVARWRAVAMQALAYTGSPLSWIGSLLRRMNQESGGNPRAINLWDINAKRGIPSKGLMQTIDPTFNAYARELRGRGVWDPFANIVASIRYANARYGAAPIGWNRAGGYDTGGILNHGQTGRNMSGRPERVLSPRQTDSFERLVRILDTKRGIVGLPGTTVVKNYNLTVTDAGNTRVDLVAQFQRLEHMSGV